MNNLEFNFREIKSFRSRNGTTSVLDVEVSCFRNYSCPDRPIPIKLLSWLCSRKDSTAVSYLRKRSKPERNFLKAQLPAITPSGLFSRREEAFLIKHSGLIQFDVDFQDNQHIVNFKDLKKEISQIQNVAYCGLSTSGNGYWGLVPIAYPERHLQHYEVLYKAFSNQGIVLDNKPKNVASLRGYSIDEEAYFNHTAKPLQIFEKPKSKKSIESSFDTSGDGQMISKVIREIEAMNLDITSGYNAWFEIGCGLANTFGENGRELFHRISQFNGKYSARRTDYQFDQCLQRKYPYTLGTIFYYCILNGLNIREKLT